MADSKYDKVEDEDPGLQNEDPPEDPGLQNEDSKSNEEDTKPQAADSDDNGDDEDIVDLKTDTKEKQDEAQSSSNYTKMEDDTDVKKNPSSYMVLSIIVFFFFPGFLGLNIILSYMVIKYKRKGKLKEAEKASKFAFELALIGFLLGFLVYTAILGYFFYYNRGDEQENDTDAVFYIDYEEPGNVYTETMETMRSK